MSDEVDQVVDEEVLDGEVLDADGGPDYEAMSDEEFLNAGPAGPVADASAADEAADGGEEGGEEGGDAGVPEGEADPKTPSAEDAAKPKEDGAKPADAGAGAAADGHTTPKQPEAKAPATTEAPDYEALYKQVMAPFKANGKEFTPGSPEEMVRLAQMGANYTKKMQALKPNLQLMRMLENNGLLEESRLSHLIDIAKGDPKAIQKLLHDTKVDPLDLDTSAAPTYTPGNHRVSEEEMSFRDTIDELTSTDAGKETIVHLNSTWDQASKKALVQEPSLLGIINEHRSNGVYAKIASEIERQQTLGRLSGVPFIEAYKVVGQRLQAEGKLAPTPASTGQEPANPGTVPVPRQVLETRAARPRQVVSNGDRAKAAAPGARTPTKSSPRSFDPFAMSDEEIMAIPAPPSR